MIDIVIFGEILSLCLIPCGNVFAHCSVHCFDSGNPHSGTTIPSSLDDDTISIDVSSWFPNVFRPCQSLRSFSFIFSILILISGFFHSGFRPIRIHQYTQLLHYCFINDTRRKREKISRFVHICLVLSRRGTGLSS